MAFSLEALDARILTRASASPDESYTARLVGKGVNACAQKLGEESVEAAIAAASGDRSGFIGEAADTLYHLLVLMRAMDVPLAEVMATLEARTARSGLEEKASRGTAD